MDKQFVHHARYSSVVHTDSGRSLWSKVWRDKNGRLVIYQFPNIWLILWFILEFISLLAPSHGVIENISWWLATACLGIWAALEIFQGANYFRRLLGLFIGVITLLTVFRVGL